MVGAPGWQGNGNGVVVELRFSCSLSDRKLSQTLWLKCFLSHDDNDQKRRNKGVGKRRKVK